MMKSSSITQVVPKMNMSLGSPTINSSMDYSQDPLNFHLPRYPERHGDYGM